MLAIYAIGLFLQIWESQHGLLFTGGSCPGARGKGCGTVFQCSVSVAPPCLTLQPMDCSPPGSSVPGIFQARILEGFAISFSMEKSLQLDKFGTKVISQRSSICEGTDIKDVVFGKLLNNSVWTGCRNLLRREAKDRLEPRSWALSWRRTSLSLYIFSFWLLLVFIGAHRLSLVVGLADFFCHGTQASCWGLQAL